MNTSDENLNQSALDPDNTPGSPSEKAPKPVRINNLPVFLGIGVVAIVVGLFVYVMADRAAAQKEKVGTDDAAEQRGKADPALTTYDALIAGFEKDQRQKELQEAREKEEESEKPEPEITPDNYPEYFSVLPSTVSPGSKTLSLAPQAQLSRPARAYITDKDAQKIHQLRIQRAEQALYASTKIDFNADPEGGNSRVGKPGGRDPLAEYREKIAAARGLSESLRGQIGGSPAGLTTGDAASEPSFMESGISDWSLKNKRVPSEAFSVKTGAIIPAIMVSGINSDLPGQVVAQVSENIFDTATGDNMLLPQGSRLVGKYDSDVAFGQSRVMLRWDRVIFPDGSTLDLAGMSGADQMGYSGFKDKVNNHYWRIFGNAFLLSLVSAAYQQSLPDDNSTNQNNSISAREQVAISMAENFNEVGSQLIRKNMNIKPTIEIRPGYKFVVMVNKDMVFNAPYREMALIGGR